MPYTFTVNGITRTTDEVKPLLRYLRDDLKLYSVKDGCSEGACGTCTIIVDGRAMRSCVLTTEKAEGKNILTVEGLTLKEKEAFVFAFGSCGAVQCGFCIPGMVMSAKALIDVDPDPTDEAIKKAIRGNICRCTGYKKIVAGIKRAAALLRGDEEIKFVSQFADEDDSGEIEYISEFGTRYDPAVVSGIANYRNYEEKNYGRASIYGVGQNVFRVDVRKKVLGYGKYPDDIGPEYFVPADKPDLIMELAGWSREELDEALNKGNIKTGVSVHRSGEHGCNACTIVDPDMPPMAYASAVRSDHPRAIVKKINKAKAESLPGVLGVLTAEDVPNNKVGHIQQDWDVFIAEGDTTRMVGDAICLVVAESPYILEEAKKQIEIEYEVLEPVRNIDEAKAENAPDIHEGGNLCQQRHVVRGDAAKALAESAYTASADFHTPFTEHAFLEPECAVSFPYKDGVKILSTDQGAYDTRKETLIMMGWQDTPEKVVVENQLIGGGFGGKEDVTVQHISALAAIKFGRPVKVKLSRKESLRVHPKRHAMDGSFTIGCDENGILTALDCEINFDTGAYASLCGPVLERACTHSVGPYNYHNTDIRGYGYYTNNPPAGAFRGFGVCQSQFALESLLNILAEKVGISPWEIRYRNAIEPGMELPNGQIADVSTALKETLEAVKPYFDNAPSDRVGIACAMKNAGVGVGLPDKGRAKLVIEDGVVYIYTAASDIGQGCQTVFCQDVAQATELPISRIRNGIANTENSPDSGTTSGSRQTLLTGEAVKGAAKLLRKAMDENGIIEDNIERLNGREFFYEYFEPTDKLGSDKPNPKSHIAYGYATNVAVLDEDGRVTDIYAAFDAGKVVNPLSMSGQIEGGVLMGMGYAVTENWPLKDCVP
ncbi:MAG: molybdopterin-dependent oxidoreductase, partial [Mogibacterium sp.]|nr:molybdopterin-dependent oxidoreductase [Mogibacterium sp.]